MSVLIFKDAEVELSTKNDCFLTDIAHLILEISVNGKVRHQVGLLSRESTPGIWDASKILILDEVTWDFTVSVSMELDGNERQLLGFMELSGPELYGTIGNRYEIPLMCHENYPGLVLRTRVLAVQNLQELLSSRGQRTTPSYDVGTVEKLHKDALATYKTYELHGNSASLERAIHQWQTASKMVPEGDPNLPDLLHNLGNALQSRFHQFGRPADINDAVEHHRSAVRLTVEGYIGRASRMCGLGNALAIRYLHLGDSNDLDNAITQQQLAVDLAADNDPNKPGYLTNLGSTLLTRFEQAGNLSDIDNSIAQQYRAVELISEGHPEKPGLLNNLGNSLGTRFKRLGDIADLNNSIKMQHESVILVQDGHPDQSMFSLNYGASLYTRFEKLGNLTDLNNSIEHQQAAVDRIPNGDPNKYLYLSNLGAALQARFKRLGNVADIDGAITRHQQAVDLTSDNHPYKSSFLNNLGISLNIRFNKLGSMTDLDMAIAGQQRAVDLTPESHPDKTNRLINLAKMLLNRWSRSIDPQDAELALSQLSSAALHHFAPPIKRLEASERWISLATFICHDSLLAAYECAIGLLPLVAWLGLPITDRHQHLVRVGGIARDAAAAAISKERYDKALEWLEQGRSIVWNQILRLRTPVDQLRDVNPDLADRLLRVSQQLDRGVVQSGFSSGKRPSMEEEGQRYRSLTAEWESIIEQVRSLPDFENFLRPLSSSQLMSAAQNGPVVVLNIAQVRCDALALLPGFDEVIHIPLPKISSERIAGLRDELKDQLYSSGIRLRGQRAAARLTDDIEEDTCPRILGELWDDLVKPILDSLAFSPHPDILPRIWWCTTGPLSFLPIHASGRYGSDSDESQLSNYVISSYAPTLSTLLGSPTSTITSSFSLLSVIQSSAPGASSIPNTKQELKYIQTRLAGRNHVVLEGPAGTKRRVTNGMEECNWLHLACHGIQRPDEPTKSALLLEDGHLTLEEIIKLKLPKAEFAFLSACQTTAGDESLSEEAVHIAGGMLLAGYRGVVATMWSIQDELAPKVTDEFYRHIMEERSRPDHRNAAEALHLSVQKLRKIPGVQLTDWIPFVHLGV